MLVKLIDTVFFGSKKNMVQRKKTAKTYQKFRYLKYCCNIARVETYDSGREQFINCLIDTFAKSAANTVV